MPLRNRNEVTERDLKGLALHADPSKVKLGFWADLQNWVMEKIGSIKKKRGPGELTPEFSGPYYTNFSACVDQVGSCPVTFSVVDNELHAFSRTDSVDCYGFLRLSQQECPASVVVEAIYKGTVAGSPITGIALRIADSSTETSFTGYGAVYDVVAGNIKLVKWVAETLETLGTVLGTAAGIGLVSGDILTLATTIDGGGLVVRKNGNQIIGNSISPQGVRDSAIPATNTGVGFIAVGAGTGTDAEAKWSDFTAGSFGCPGLLEITDEGDEPTCDEVFPGDPIASNSALTAATIPGDEFPGSSPGPGTEIMTINNHKDGTDCYGTQFLPVVCPPPFFVCPNDFGCTWTEVFMQFTGTGNNVGTPRAGICFAVRSESTADDFTGYGVVVDYTVIPAQTHFVKWVNQTLKAFTTQAIKDANPGTEFDTWGTILWSAAGGPETNGWLYVQWSGFSPADIAGGVDQELNVFLSNPAFTSHPQIGPVDFVDNSLPALPTSYAGILSIGTQSENALDQSVWQKFGTDCGTCIGGAPCNHPIPQVPEMCYRWIHDLIFGGLTPPLSQDKLDFCGWTASDVTGFYALRFLTAQALWRSTEVDYTQDPTHFE